MCVPGTECPVLRMVVSNSYTNGTATYTNLNTLTSATNDQLYFTRSGNNSPLSEILASVDHVCKFNNDVSYWGSQAESKYLRSNYSKTTGNVTYTCEGGADDRFEQLVSFNQVSNHSLVRIRFQSPNG